MPDFRVMVIAGEDYSDYGQLKQVLDKILSAKGSSHTLVFLTSGTAKIDVLVEAQPRSTNHSGPGVQPFSSSHEILLTINRV